MNYQVQVTPRNLSFNSEDTDTILEAALNAMINLPHSCKEGSCGACKCKATTGSYKYPDGFQPLSLNEQEITDGYVLTCKAHAQSDITLHLPDFNGWPIKVLPAKIETLEKTASLAILTLTLPSNQKFDFYAGQYIDLNLNGITRSYSIANGPNDSGKLELHIRYRKGGALSEMLWNNVQPRQLVRLKGPLGSFTLNDSQTPLLLVCTGTGFAPVKSLLEYIRDKQIKRKIHLIWGNYGVEDFYLLDLLKKWQEQLDLSLDLCASAESHPGYYQGMVTEYIAEHYSDLSDYEVYACGNTAMIESLLHTTTTLNLPREKFFSDSFTPSK
jgi:CDP-4-dehydro-6-deoxyglucose reductase